MYHNDRLVYINTGYIGRFRIGTYGKHIFAKRSFVPDKPHYDYDNNCIPYIVWNRNAAQRQLAACYKALKGIIQAGKRLAVVSIDHNIHQQSAVYDQLGSQSNDKGMKLKLGYEKPLTILQYLPQP